MKRSGAFVLIILLLLVAVPPRPATAIMTFDPTANKTLMAIWGKLTVMYTTIKGHLDTAVEMEEIMSDANATYQTISNLDISEIAEDFKSGDILNGAGPFGKLGMLQLEIEDKVSAGEDHVDYAVAQKNRIQNLRRLAKLKTASFKNMGKASRDLKERDSSQITAQSTATLAALATIEEDRKGKKAIAEARAKNEERKTIRQLGKIYTAMGK